MNTAECFGNRFWLLALTAVMLVSAVQPAAALSTPELSVPPGQLELEELSPEEKVGQLFLISFNDTDVSAAAPIHDLIVNYHVGGVILRRTNNNFSGPDTILEDLWSLTRGLQLIEFETSRSSGGPPAQDPDGNEYIPLFIGISQEGNLSPYSELLAGISPIPSQMALGATWDPELAEQLGSQVGRELSSLGINMLFGPSLDVVSNPNPGQSDLGVRSFGGDPYWVGKFGQAYIQGIHNGSLNNIAVVGKFFPGLGSSDRLPDEEVATVRKSLEQLKQIDLAPFFAVTGQAPSPDAAVDALLNSHIRYQGLQGNIRSTTRPISLDRQAFDLLMSQDAFGTWREDGGVIISDNLGSQAIQQLYDPSGESFDISRVAVDAFIAGNDMLYLGNSGDQNKPIPSHQIIETLEFFTQRYNEDQEFAARVDASVQRILDLKNEIYTGFNLSTVLTSQNTLSAIGNSDLSEIITRESSTLVNPGLAELTSILESPPGAADRLVILTDTETARLCEDCQELETLSVTALEDAIIRLYGPFSGRQLVRANITSYSFKDLTNLLDFPGETEQMVTDLFNANWIIIASLDVSEDRPYSQALPRLLAERQDLLRDKKIILFSLGAPYYLDATNISKISGFFALYTKLPASLDVSARILFNEFTSFTGSLPVSVPGLNYDLISATSPDPQEIFPIYIGAKPDPSESILEPDTTPAPPVYRVEDTINLFTGIIIDHNGNPVPDGTPVTFLLTSQGSTRSLPAVTTVNGSATSSFIVESSSNIIVQAESAEARSSVVEINILGENGDAETGEPDATSESDTTSETASGLQDPESSDESEPVPALSPWRDWGFSLFSILLVSLIAYQVGATSGRVRWGIRWSLACLITGLSVYNYLILELPGVNVLFSGGMTRLGLGLMAMAGAALGWLAVFLAQKIFGP